MTRTSRNVMGGLIVTVGLGGIGWTVSAHPAESSPGTLQAQDQGRVSAEDLNRARRPGTVSEVLDWNQIFVDTLIATNTANSSSQRLGAIVHTAIFDAYNGVEQRYSPIFVNDTAPRGTSRRAAVIAAGHKAPVGLFPARQPQLDALYAAS